MARIPTHLTSEQLAQLATKMYGKNAALALAHRDAVTQQNNIVGPQALADAGDAADAAAAAQDAVDQAILDATALAAVVDAKANKDLTDVLVADILAKVAGQITDTEITPGGISTPSLATDSVTADQIDVAYLSVIAEDVGTVKAGVVQNQTGSAKFDLNNSRIVFDNGTVVKVTGLGFGTSSQFIEWIGLRAGIVFGGVVNFALCSEANAIQYVTVTGDAYFGGSLSAGILKNGATSTLESTGLVLTVGPFETSGGSRSVVLSYTLHQYGAQTGNHAGAGTINATIQLHRKVNGGAATLIATLNVTGNFTAMFDGETGNTDWSASASGSTTTTDSTGSAGDDIEYTATITSQTCSTAGWTITTNSQTTTIISTE